MKRGQTTMETLRQHTDKTKFIKAKFIRPILSFIFTGFFAMGISGAFAAASSSHPNNTASTPVIKGLNDNTDNAANTDKAKTSMLDSLFTHEGFSLSEYQDSVLGFVGEAKVSSYLFSHNQAAALELNGGPRIFRLNATYGLNLTDKQRLKITGERLDEKLDFDFNDGFGADTVSEWVGQNAAGADYAYMLDSKRLESLGIGGYYTHSPSKDLASETLHDSVNNLDYLGERRIAGANSGNIHTNLAARLWPYSRISGGVDYDTVHFDTHYTSDQDVNGLGGHAAVEQRLLPNVKLTVGSDFRQTERGYTAGLGWLTPSIKGLQTEVEATTDYTKDLTSNLHYYTTGVRFNVAFDDLVGGSHQAIYSDLNPGAQQSLLDWTQTPAVRMSNVLAVTDGVAVPKFIACPEPGTLTKVGNRYVSPDGWISDPTNYNGTPVFLQASYDFTGALCDYSTNKILMSNPNAGQNTGNFWVTSSSKICDSSTGATSASSCHFVDKRF